jgi:hypothetical protein
MIADTDAVPVKSAANIDVATVASFGAEWTQFDQSTLPPDELQRSFDGYLESFPWHVLKKDAEGFVMGCGSGRGQNSSPRASDASTASTPRVTHSPLHSACSRLNRT